MKIDIEVNTVEELVAIFALIRTEEIDSVVVSTLTNQLAASASALKAAEDAVPSTK